MLKESYMYARKKENINQYIYNKYYYIYISDIINIWSQSEVILINVTKFWMNKSKVV